MSCSSSFVSDWDMSSVTPRVEREGGRREGSGGGFGVVIAMS